MTDKQKGKATEDNQDVVFADWIRSQVGVWEEAMKQTTRNLQPPFPRPDSEGSGTALGPDMIFREFFELFQALSSRTGMPKPEDFESANSIGDLMLKILQPFWGYSIKLEKQWAEMLGTSYTGETENMAEFLKQTTKTIHHSQMEDFRKILNMPQVGLTRYYQERLNKVIENASDFQSALSEFLQLLMIPMEKAYYAVQEEITRLERGSKAAFEDSQALYQLWIQKLEDHYLELLRSPDYIETLRDTLNKMHDFRAARAEFLMDLLQYLPIPTNRDMDELYRDVYILKKRVKELERKEAQRKTGGAVRIKTKTETKKKREEETPRKAEKAARREPGQNTRLTESTKAGRRLKTGTQQKSAERKVQVKKDAKG